ncbi:N-acetyl-gamma-glutamyl-phosphate reductase [Acetanaerobacterium elongatum]|uniref:N-acetyl-gamma-glutamyl-phosphate reductase n=1 Tax=Acetanaerobacterium elongatum TaxID=258515 RepID=A0A1H0G115_9FIRM|nr:N-acetyl-gamma-glutamyl-phosphate reductase [Acetanaerobacterium elongatum]SDO00552.1 N-acetyl-gamma-glutamyl-phosphate reductase [Acetanaerobacterium elongatum]
MKKVFIDGKEGTTGLKIFERFEGRNDLEILTIAEEKRKDVSERKRLINEADVVFLCLPDEAARESVSLVENEKTIVIDASTAHRTLDNWAYGLPELSPKHREAVCTGRRISVPGCYATGFITIATPLVALGILPKDYPVTAYGISGYSGGGKKLIAEYEATNRAEKYDSPRIYALSLSHKHIPEMHKHSGLTYKPLLNPIVCDYYNGMAVSMPLCTRLLNKKLSPSELAQQYAEYYAGQQFISVLPYDEVAEGVLYTNTLAGTNRLEIIVCGNDEQLTVISRFDNLGKGASGAAVQCMNLALGVDEATGL